MEAGTRILSDLAEEFEVEGTVNSLNMNDAPYEPGADAERTRIFVLGDSHTYAVGVSWDQTWSKVLKRLDAAYRISRIPRL